MTALRCAVYSAAMGSSLMCHFNSLLTIIFYLSSYSPALLTASVFRVLFPTAPRPVVPSQAQLPFSQIMAELSKTAL